MFDYRMRPAPECVGMEIALAVGADAVTAELFPHLSRGMFRGLTSEIEQGRVWTGVRVEVQKIHTHPIDTTAQGCERYGFSFATHELRFRGLLIHEQSDSNTGRS
jgi:hypothetical protein